MNLDCVIIGAGLTGLTAARKLADNNKRVMVVDEKPVIGGLCRESYYKNTRYSVYGPHMFHTNSKEVWDFLSRFTEWNYDVKDYVKSYDLGKLWTIPIDRDEIGNTQYYEKSMEERLYKNYTHKMWGDKYGPVMMENSLKRITTQPRWPHDHRYFTDKYQAIPDQGYNRLFTGMVNTNYIQLALGGRVKVDDFMGVPIIYTGRLDHLLEKDILPFRYMDFVFQVSNDFPWSDIHSVINFPYDYDFIRAHSSKRLYKQDVTKDIIVYEYPNDSIGTACYPVVCKETTDLFTEILKEVNESYPNIIPAGRLGKFRYLNMDQAVMSGLDAAELVLKGLDND